MASLRADTTERNGAAGITVTAPPEVRQRLEGDGSEWIAIPRGR
jgi:hypothetical protein